mgnify:CR=1 FL=1
MPKIVRRRLIEKGKDDVWRWLFWCPGCEEHHAFEEGRWTKSGTDDAPTFSPSLVSAPGTPRNCHLFVRAGKIQFLGDCWHGLKGQTVDLPECDW